MSTLIPIRRAIPMTYPHLQLRRRGSEWSWSRFFMLPLAVAAMAAVGVVAGPVQAHAQKPQIYKDPGGVYSVLVPASWTTKSKPGNPMVSIVNATTNVTVTLGAIRGPEANTPTPEMELDGIKSQFPHICPQAKTLDHGPTKLAGLSGAFITVSCAAQSGPETMKYAVATGPGVVAMLTVDSPGASYPKVQASLRAIEDSLKIQAGTAAQGPGGSGPGAGAGQFAAVTISGPGVYRDPQGRYSLKIPVGWTAKSDASGAAQLSHGASAATVFASGGTKPLDVNHQVARQIQGQYEAFQLMNEGDLQIGGRPAHGANISAINQKGVQVSVLVVTVGAGGGNFLTIASSAPNEQAREINATVMEIAKSVRFEGD